MSLCECHGCQLNEYRGGKCAIHYEQQPENASEYLSVFYDQLLDYTVNFLIKESNNHITLTYDTVKKLLLGPTEDWNRGVPSKKVTYKDIKFPAIDNADKNYLSLLRRVSYIYFENCIIKNRDFKGINSKLHFNKCTFMNDWKITNCLSLVETSLYNQCHFMRDVIIDSDLKVDVAGVFHNCIFDGNIEISNSIVDVPIFINDGNRSWNLQCIRINDSTIKSRFEINNAEIIKLHASNTSFESKFEFKGNKVSDFILFDVNYYKVFDSHKTKYNSFIVEKCIFTDFAGFECCEFSYDNQITSTLKYVTFTSFVNFRNSTFKFGLDVERVNFKESPSFLHSYISPAGTNRETYRIIKNSFEKVGNNIEANKYFSLEMRKYEVELSGSRLSQEKIIFWLNKSISNFGMNYFKPMWLIFLFSFLYKVIIDAYDKRLLYKIYPDFNDYINGVCVFFNSLAVNIIPFGKFLHPGMEFVSLIFYVIFASLIWQTIVSIKKHTRTG